MNEECFAYEEERDLDKEVSTVRVFSAYVDEELDKPWDIGKDDDRVIRLTDYQLTVLMAENRLLFEENSKWERTSNGDLRRKLKDSDAFIVRSSVGGVPIVTVEGNDGIRDMLLAASKRRDQLPPRSRKIFIVHGHNKEVLQYIVQVLRNWDLEPVVLSESAPLGNVSLIEAIETCIRDVDFGIVLETPDDTGTRESQHKEDTQDRDLHVRPNVIFECGMLIGMLGRENVVRLRTQANRFDMPSDLDGLMRIEFEEIDAKDVVEKLWINLRKRRFMMRHCRFDERYNKANMLAEYAEYNNRPLSASNMKRMYINKNSD